MSSSLRRWMPGGPMFLMLGAMLGLAWPALAASARPLMPAMIGAAVTPRMALHFAAAQLPIYMLPRLLWIFIRPSAAVALERN